MISKPTVGFLLFNVRDDQEHFQKSRPNHKRDKLFFFWYNCKKNFLLGVGNQTRSLSVNMTYDGREEKGGKEG